MADEVWRRELADGEKLEVFRLVHVSTLDDGRLDEGMKSNAEKGRPPRGREIRQPEIHRGVSVYRSRAQAASLRRRIADRLRQQGSTAPIAIGDHIARIVLHGPGFACEDRDEPDGHMTIWGEPSRLAEETADICPADSDQ